MMLPSFTTGSVRAQPLKNTTVRVARGIGVMGPSHGLIPRALPGS